MLHILDLPDKALGPYLQKSFDDYPAHDERRCGWFGPGGYLCARCEAYLAGHPMSTWTYWIRLRRRQGRGLPAPLQDKFCERLALEIADRPELFAPIIRFILSQD